MQVHAGPGLTDNLDTQIVEGHVLDDPLLHELVYPGFALGNRDLLIFASGLEHLILLYESCCCMLLRKLHHCYDRLGVMRMLQIEVDVISSCLCVVHGLW